MDVRLIGILLLLGAANAFGMIRYVERVSQPGVPAASFIVTVSVAVVAIAPVIEGLMSGKWPSAEHLVGYICAAAAIFFLAG